MRKKLEWWFWWKANPIVIPFGPIEIPALGLPGASNWREDRDARHLNDIETIYIVVEPDRGGEAVKAWLSRSSIRHRVKLLHLPVKDPSALHLQDAGGFKKAWTEALRSAIPWTAEEAETQAKDRSEAWEQCKDLAHCQDILAELDAALARVGLVGERRVAKLLYLAVTSRLLDRPVSVAVKGPSSGGKSFVGRVGPPVLSKGRVLRPDRDERPRPRLFDRAAAAPPSRDLRGGRAWRPTSPPT